MSQNSTPEIQESLPKKEAGTINKETTTSADVVTTTIPTAQPAPAVPKVVVNSIVEGEVLRIKPFGAIVLLPDRSQGLVHISHISSRYVQTIEEFVNVGDRVMVKVISVDPENGKISLSMRDAEPPAPRQQNRPAFHDNNRQQSDSSSFEDKFKDFLKASNERHAGLNKRNKRK